MPALSVRKELDYWGSNANASMSFAERTDMPKSMDALSISERIIKLFWKSRTLWSKVAKWTNSEGPCRHTEKKGSC